MICSPLRLVVAAARRIAFVCIALAAVTASAGPVLAAYQLGIGDVVEVSVFGAPDLTRRTTVNADGQITVPPVGEVDASGRTVPELRIDIERKLIEAQIMRKPAVSVEIVEHRPFYVKGDIANSGAYPYVPGMTVRHAVALAGGYGPAAADHADDLLALRGEYAELWFQVLQARARLEGLSAELRGSGSIELGTAQTSPDNRPLLDQITGLEEERLKLRLDARSLRADFLKRSVDLLDDRIDLLGKQIDEGREVVSLQNQTLENAQALVKKGLTPAARLMDEQQSLSLLRSQLLETSATMADARRTREELTFEVEAEPGKRRAELLDEYQKTLLELQRLQGQFQTAGERLMRSGETIGEGRYRISIIREMGESTVRTDASEDSHVLAGDIVEIAFEAPASAIGLTPAPDDPTTN